MNSDIWLPLVYDEAEAEFNWNLDLYNLNYERIPALLKQLDNALNWSSRSFLYPDNWFTTEKAGYDFFVSEDAIEFEYKYNPHPDFDLPAYLEKIRKAQAPYLDQYGKK